MLQLIFCALSIVFKLTLIVQFQLILLGTRLDKLIEANEVFSLLNTFPANIYLFKGNNRNTRKSCKICSKLTIKTPE